MKTKKNIHLIRDKTWKYTTKIETVMTMMNFRISNMIIKKQIMMRKTSSRTTITMMMTEICEIN